MGTHGATSYGGTGLRLASAVGRGMQSSLLVPDTSRRLSSTPGSGSHFTVPRTSREWSPHPAGSSRCLKKGQGSSARPLGEGSCRHSPEAHLLGDSLGVSADIPRGTLWQCSACNLVPGEKGWTQLTDCVLKRKDDLDCSGPGERQGVESSTWQAVAHEVAPPIWFNFSNIRMKKKIPFTCFISCCEDLMK